MKRFTLALLALAAGVTRSEAEIPRDPDYTLLWNSFTTVTVVDSFAVVTANDGLEVLKFEPSTSLYRSDTHILTSSKGRDRKQYGPLLVVRTYDDLLHFYDLSHLPELLPLGSVDIGVPYFDFAIRDQSLYLACGFKGVWRYQLNDYRSPVFADSSMLGIHCMKVDISDDELLVIDDYNGVLRYRLTSGGFGQFLDYMYIPFVARSMVRRDSTLVILAGVDQLWVAHYHADGSSRLDSVNLLFEPQSAYVTDTTIFGVGGPGNLAAIVNRSSHSVSYRTLKGQPDFQRQGALRIRGKRTDLVVPGSNDLLTYSLDDIAFNASPTTGLERPGPINSLHMRGGLLFTAGVSNPLDVYRIGADGSPTYDTSYFPGLSEVTGMDRNGDTLFAYYPTLKQILVLVLSSDTLVLQGSIPVGTDELTSVKFSRHAGDTMSAIIAPRGSEIDIWGIPDSGTVVLTSTIRMFGRISKVVTADSFIVITTNKGLWIYRLFPDLTVAFRNRIDLVDQANEICWYNNRLFVFIGNDLTLYQVMTTGELVPELEMHIPTGVYNSVIAERRMYTVGPFGMTVLDVSSPVPTVLDWGGRGGSLIAVEHGIVAISDGSSIHLFDLRGVGPNFTGRNRTIPSDLSLEPNFPNPFNAVTTISYSLNEPSNVQLDVLNILGERVAILTDMPQTAGCYRVEWNGTNQRGHEVATGVYFYRLRTDGRQVVRKMLFLK